jgi:hypothetical protein
LFNLPHLISDGWVDADRRGNARPEARARE